MIAGVNFQPGQSGPGGQKSAKTGTAIQEAIKVLSLRLPKVVGAQAMSPQGLLASQGSGGNPRIDSVVNTVLGRMFPTGGGAAPAPAMPSGPTFGGGAAISPTTPLSSLMGQQTDRRPMRAPRVSPGETTAPGEVRSTPAPPWSPNDPTPPAVRFDDNPPPQVHVPATPAPPWSPSDPTPPPVRFDTNPPPRAVEDPDVFKTPASPEIPVEQPRTIGQPPPGISGPLGGDHLSLILDLLRRKNDRG